MRSKFLISIFMFLLLFSFVVNFVQAANIEISQSGADSGTVMKGKSFTVTVSGLSGSGTVTLVLPTGFSTSESSTKSFSEGTTSVSWSTVVANQKVSGTEISATITVLGSPEAATSDSFDVILSPSISVSISPESTSTSAGSTYTVSINIQNSGETTARFGSITVSGTGMTKSSGCSPSDISGGGNAAVTCTVSASTAGIYDVDFTISPSNADAVTESISVSVSSVDGSTTTTTPGGPGGGGGPGGTPAPEKKKSQTWTKITPGSAEIMQINDPDIGLKMINITVKNPVNTVTIIVTKLEGKPASVVHNVSGKVYKYIEITPTNIPDENISVVKIQFQVNKSWINSNNIDRAKVYLNRYKNNAWQRLTTRMTTEDGTYVYYEADSSGFSTFAVTGEELTTTTVATTATTIATTVATTTETTILSIPPTVSGIPTWIIGVIIIIIVAIVLLVWKFMPKKQTVNISEFKVEPIT